MLPRLPAAIEAALVRIVETYERAEDGNGLTVLVPRATYRRIERACDATGVSLRAYVLAALRDALRARYVPPRRPGRLGAQHKRRAPRGIVRYDA